MSDDQTPPPIPVRKRAANVNRRADIHARPRRDTPPSRESRFIGYLVLGFGVLAVIAVAIIALNRGQTNNEATQETAKASDPAYNFGTQYQSAPPAAPTDLNNRAARDLSRTLADVPSAPRREVKRDLNFTRQPNVDAAAIEGTWQGVIGKYTAVLKIGGGRYQVVLADPYQYGYRPYSSGTYTKIEDILRLTPQNDWPAPASPPGTKINYSNITSAPFPVIAAILEGKMLWQNPPRSEKRILVPYALPLFVGEKQDYIVWERLSGPS